MKRQSKNLSSALEYRLNMYALAASAAGVGVLALAQPSEAKIVYTKTHRVIRTNGIYQLDLNHDGTVDFLIQELGHASSSLGVSNAILAKGALGNGVEAYPKSDFAAALKRGACIGPGQQFISSSSYRGQVMAQVWATEGGSGKAGPWVNVASRYLGLRFEIHGKAHYGWARLSVRLQRFSITATLTGYAYETVPNKPLQAGQTGGADNATRDRISYDPEVPSLGMLALGAPDASTRRRP